MRSHSDPPVLRPAESVLFHLLEQTVLNGHIKELKEKNRDKFWFRNHLKAKGILYDDEILDEVCGVNYEKLLKKRMYVCFCPNFSESNFRRKSYQLKFLSPKSATSGV